MHYYFYIVKQVYYFTMPMWRNAETNKWKKGKIAAVGGGAAVGGLTLWSLFDPSASEKAGNAASGVGGTFGTIIGGVTGGLTGGIFQSFMSPAVLSAIAASSSSVCFAVVIMMMLRH